MTAHQSVGMGESGQDKVFRVRQSLRSLLTIFMVLAGLGAAFFVLVIPAAARDVGTISQGLLYILVLLFMAYTLLSAAWLLHYIAFRTFVSVSAAGIRFCCYGVSGDTTWDNAYTLGTLGSGRTRLWGLITRKPMIIKHDRLFYLFFYVNPVFYNSSAATLIPLREFVPQYVLSPEKFRATPLGAEIAQHAPHVFEHAAQKR